MTSDTPAPQESTSRPERHQITPATKIDQGIVTRPDGLEIAIDSTTPRLSAIITDFENRAKTQGAEFTNHAPNFALATTYAHIPTNPDRVKAIKELAQLKRKTRYALENHLVEKAGDPISQALFCGLLLEKLKEKGHISGTARFYQKDNSQTGQKDAWIRYDTQRTEGMHTIIIDPSQELLNSWEKLTPDQKAKYGT